MKYALIGCGRISPNHIAAARANDLEFVGICDIDCSIIQDKFKKFDLQQVTQYTDYKEMIAAERPDEVSKMPYAYSPNSLALGHNWSKLFKQKTWDKLVSEVVFHKVAYQIDKKLIGDNENYYNYIIREYGKLSNC